jgi:hypothetical protein
VQVSGAALEPGIGFEDDVILIDLGVKRVDLSLAERVV